MKVQSTTDYGIFKRLAGNRQLSKRNLNKISRSIIKRNLLSEYPIIVNTKMEVIDGQHRLEIAKVNDFTIYYTIVDNLTLSDVQQLNYAVQSWQMRDYLNSYMELGYEPYKILSDFIQKSGFSLSNAGMLLTAGANVLSGGFFKGARTKFKEGQLEIESDALEKGDRIIGIFEDLKPFLKSQTLKNDRYLLQALLKIDWLVEENLLNWSELLAKFDESGYIIERMYSPKQYLRFFEDTYGYNRKTKLRFF